MSIGSSNRRSFVKLLAATPLLTQIAARISGTVTKVAFDINPQTNATATAKYRHAFGLRAYQT